MYGRSDQSATFENDPLLPEGSRAFTRVCTCARTRMHARHHAHVTLLRAAVGVLWMGVWSAAEAAMFQVARIEIYGIG